MDKNKIDVDQILNQLSIRILTTKEVSHILNSPIEFPTAVAEKIALETALKYYHKEITYEDGDCIMNNIYTFWWTNELYVKNYGFSETAWECYEAFDAGEYHHANDFIEIDPVEKYTKPLIEDMLKKRKLI